MDQKHKLYQESCSEHPVSAHVIAKVWIHRPQHIIRIYLFIGPMQLSISFFILYSPYCPGKFSHFFYRITYLHLYAGQCRMRKGIPVRINEIGNVIPTVNPWGKPKRVFFRSLLNSTYRRTGYHGLGFSDRTLLLVHSHTSGRTQDRQRSPGHGHLRQELP